jgi:hypothetical protein
MKNTINSEPNFLMLQGDLQISTIISEYKSYWSSYPDTLYPHLCLSISTEYVLVLQFLNSSFYSPYV